MPECTVFCVFWFDSPTTCPAQKTTTTQQHRNSLGITACGKGTLQPTGKHAVLKLKTNHNKGLHNSPDPQSSKTLANNHVELGATERVELVPAKPLRDWHSINEIFQPSIRRMEVQHTYVLHSHF